MSAIFALVKRDWLNYLRQRSRIIASVITPLLFWLLIGTGLGSSFRSSGSNNYLDYFFPGIILLSALFTAIFSTITIIEDRKSGFLQSVLVSPISKSKFLISRVLSGASLAIFQTLLLISFAPFIGFKLTLIKLAGILLLIFLMAAVFILVSFLFAWKMESVQGFHSIMNLILMPLWLLSGSVFPLEGSHKFYTYIIKLNPLYHGLQAFRDILVDSSYLSFKSSFLFLVVSCLLLFVLCNLVVNKQRNFKLTNIK